MDIGAFSITIQMGLMLIGPHADGCPHPNRPCPVKSKAGYVQLDLGQPRSNPTSILIQDPLFDCIKVQLWELMVTYEILSKK